MSTKAIREALERMRFVSIDGEERQLYRDARAELAAIEQAATTLTRLNVGDYVYDIRERQDVMDWLTQYHEQSTWYHPDVKAWSDASVLLSNIAKESK